MEFSQRLKVDRKAPPPLIRGSISAFRHGSLSCLPWHIAGQWLGKVTPNSGNPAPPTSGCREKPRSVSRVLSINCHAAQSLTETLQTMAAVNTFGTKRQGAEPSRGLGSSCRSGKQICLPSSALEKISQMDCWVNPDLGTNLWPRPGTC